MGNVLASNTSHHFLSLVFLHFVSTLHFYVACNNKTKIVYYDLRYPYLGKKIIYTLHIGCSTTGHGYRIEV